MQKLFFEKYKTSEVTNTRSVINTPSAFTRKNFFHIQEAGYLKSLKSHLSRRSELNSYLFFCRALRQWRGHLPRTVIRRRNDLFNGACG